MKKRMAWEVCVLMAVLPLVSGQDATTKPGRPPARDVKGDFFIVVIDPSGSAETGSLLKKDLNDLFAAGKAGVELVMLDAAAPDAVAERILTLPARKRERLAGIVNLRCETGHSEAAAAVIEVYHYAFAPIAEEHIASPEYSLKFGSDSALLGICLHRRMLGTSRGEDPVFSSVDVRPTTTANPHLPREILRKSVGLIYRIDGALTPDEAGDLAEVIFDAVSAFRRDEGCHVMGLLPEKVQRHAQVQDVEIRVFKYAYPDKQLAEEEQKKRDEETVEPVSVVRPFGSNLYYVADLDHLSPYSVAFIDASKDEEHYWHRVDDGSFVTSSLGGIVRTVPCRFEQYEPLANKYQEATPASPAVDTADYVIANATVFDGSRDRPRFVADVGIAGERIVAVDRLEDVPRRVTIDGEGLFLTPGFIDIHSHADSNVLRVPYAASHIRQGITTVLGGNCSFSPLGVGAFYRRVDEEGAALNIGALVGNRPVRNKVLGRRKGMPSYTEVYREKELVDLAMEEGAFGMSTGLIYSISEEAFAWELAELAKQVKPYGGFYASHVRGETDEVLDAIREAIYIGDIAEVPVQISHMKVINKRNWGDMEQYLDVMKAARARGLDLTGDQYPWRASGPAAHYSLHTLAVREAIRNESPDVVLLKDMPGKYAKYSGRLLTELLDGEGMTPEELIADLNLTKDSKVFATYLCLGDEDVRHAMKEDFVMVCTDSSLASLEAIENGKCLHEHPRKFRTYPEFFAKYVRDGGVCSWELGVYKCTGLPAKRMKLVDRGVIKPGAFADLVLLDPDELDPGADYRDQAPVPKGIRWVFLNGQPVLKEGELTKVRAGKALRAYGHRKP